ncbi:lipid-transfer protein [Jatrophihabitans sp.]|uniref:thiolase C-terminal domain-containing protein n=1 Tax=Jatrophihabitans sp. TaxID=1932789 RepID=UPI0030C6F49E|nr:lipid-transfer protein [Jatrophihabitans sp.]
MTADSAILDGKVAIVGIGHTEYRKRGELAHRGTYSLACEAIANACADAGISPSSIDGYSGYAYEAVEPLRIAAAFGAPKLGYAGMVWGGGGGGVLGAVVNASMALVCGYADYVVIYRSLTMSQATGRFGQLEVEKALTGDLSEDLTFSGPYGLLSPAQVFALNARRHMHRYGTTIDQLGEIAVNARRMAATNPDARFREPLTLQQHHDSRMIADPLRLLDCCMESDGAAAVVLTRTDRAADLAQSPVYVRSSAMGADFRYSSRLSVSDDDFASAAQTSLAEQLFARAAIRPDDIDVALLYDHFTPMVLMSLEDFGFCAKGEGGPFVADGQIGLTGTLPLNPHGGHLAEVYLHGMNHILEATRQLRGTAVNQVPSADLALVGGAGGVNPTTGCVLSR